MKLPDLLAGASAEASFVPDIRYSSDGVEGDRLLPLTAEQRGDFTRLATTMN
ncbi:MAG TPA: hypothetical protein VIJ07_24265 [Dermatophilaceae bacterium]